MEAHGQLTTMPLWLIGPCVYHTRAPIMYVYAQLHMRILDSRDIASAER